MGVSNGDVILRLRGVATNWNSSCGQQLHLFSVILQFKFGETQLQRCMVPVLNWPEWKRDSRTMHLTHWLALNYTFTCGSDHSDRTVGAVLWCVGSWLHASSSKGSESDAVEFSEFILDIGHNLLNTMLTADTADLLDTLILDIAD